MKYKEIKIEQPMIDGQLVENGLFDHESIMKHIISSRHLTLTIEIKHRATGQWVVAHNDKHESVFNMSEML